MATKMIDIDEMYRFVQFIANKEQSGFIKPSQFNIAAERAQMQLFMQRYGNPKEYVPGRPVPRVAFAQSQKVQDDFNAFVMEVSYTGGEIDLESLACGYAHLVRLVTTADAPVKLVDISEFDKLNNSSLLAPTADYPIAYFGNNKTIYVSAAAGTISYLRFPNVPLWDYFKNAQGQPLSAASGTVVAYPVFDSSATTSTITEGDYSCTNTHNPYENCTNFEFPYDCFNEIAVMILSYVGINLREPMLAQYAEAKQQQGI